MQYACMCGEREGLGAKSFLDLTDRNVGAVFWQCFLSLFFFSIIIFLRRQHFQMKIILLKFFGPSLQFPCESNFPLHRVMVWDSDFAQNFTERNIVQNNDLQKT